MSLFFTYPDKPIFCPQIKGSLIIICDQSMIVVCVLVKTSHVKAVISLKESLKKYNKILPFVLLFDLHH